MKYFAYGSNMSTVRLRHRIGSAVNLGVYSLPFHTLRFHKAGKDGSGKCDAFFTDHSKDKLPGVIFEIDSKHKQILDRIEGLGIGYMEKIVTVYDATGNGITAFTYTALQTDPQLIPFSWYKHHVLAGAVEAGLPADYIALIESIPTLADADTHRHQNEIGIYFS